MKPQVSVIVLAHNEGEAIVPAFTGTKNEMGGYIESAKKYGWQPVYAVAANATPSGTLTQETGETIRDAIKKPRLVEQKFDEGLRPHMRFDDGRRSKKRDDRLTGADVAVQEPQHAVRLRKIGDNLGDRALLRRGERIGQGLDDACAQKAFGRGATAGPRTHPPAQERKRQLAGEQFVISEARPGGTFRI